MLQLNLSQDRKHAAEGKCAAGFLGNTNLASLSMGLCTRLLHIALIMSAGEESKETLSFLGWSASRASEIVLTLVSGIDD